MCFLTVLRAGSPRSWCQRGGVLAGTLLLAQGAVIHVAPEQSTYAVCVLGTETKLDVYG